MFPNVRLLIGTLFIALLVLSCEFGVFAALRVNREPLNRLTAESAPLQLAAGHNAPLAMATSWAAPRYSRVTAADAAPAQRVIETPAPGTGGAAGAPGNEVTAAVPQPALSPAPAAVPVQEQAPVPLAPPAAGAAPAQGVPAPAANAAAEAQPAQAAPDSQAHGSLARASEPASGAPVAAALPAAAAPALAAQPAEITGSISNVATPDAVLPEAETPLPKPAPKIAHELAKKAGKAVRKPAQLHTGKKRIVRRAPAPAAASSAQPANTFDNPVFQSAPQIQSPAKKRPGTKKAATNNNFANPFGAQSGTQ